MFLITVVLIKITSSLYFHDWADDLSSRIHLIHLNGISSVDQSSLSTKWPRQFSYSKTFQYPDSSNTTNLSLENEVNPSLIVFFYNNVLMSSLKIIYSTLPHHHFLLITFFCWSFPIFLTFLFSAGHILSSPCMVFWLYELFILPYFFFSPYLVIVNFPLHHLIGISFLSSVYILSGFLCS